MNINFQGPCCQTGYGIASKNILIALHKLNNYIGYFPIGQPQVETEEEGRIIGKLIDNQANFDYSAPSIRFWHQFNMAEHIGNGPKFGFPIFELDQFNKKELHNLNFLDEIIVTSQWAKDVIAADNIEKPIHIVPLGVNPAIFYPNGKHGLAPRGNRPYTFLNISKFEYRKGHLELAEIFNKAFTKDDDVQLLMMCHNPFLNEAEVNAFMVPYKNSPLGDKVLFLDPCPTHHHLAGLIRGVDCGVFPTKAEGWGMGCLEMMACGKPVIVTNYSALTEYCNDKNSFLINITEKEIANDGKWFTSGIGSWAKFDEPQIEQTIEYMRVAYKNRIMDNPEGVETAKQFTWENSAKQLLSNIG